MPLLGVRPISHWFNSGWLFALPARRRLARRPHAQVPARLPAARRVARARGVRRLSRRCSAGADRNPRRARPDARHVRLPCGAAARGLRPLRSRFRADRELAARRPHRRRARPECSRLRDGLRSPRLRFRLRPLETYGSDRACHPRDRQRPGRGRKTRFSLPSSRSAISPSAAAAGRSACSRWKKDATSSAPPPLPYGP